MTTGIVTGPLPLSVCGKCNGIHAKGRECSESHHPACFCIRCRGQPYEEWMAEQTVERALTQDKGEEMIPKYSGNSNRSNSGGRSSNKGKPSGIQWLRNEDCSTDRTTAKIIGVKVGADNFGNDVVNLKIAFKGQTFLDGIRTNNPNLEILTHAFGDDENGWVGQELLIYLEEDDFSGKKYRRYEPKAGAITPRKGR